MNQEFIDPSLHHRFEFRYIRPEEADQAAKIEEICFPPNEACSAKMMKERVAAAPDFFLVAADREDREACRIFERACHGRRGSQG